MIFNERLQNPTIINHHIIQKEIYYVIKIPKNPCAFCFVFSGIALLCERQPGRGRAGTESFPDKYLAGGESCAGRRGIAC
ncbi:MAG: hypothetical protein LBM04_12410 [Opitutaceae bacterium]|nr:hypothetical protein [Opitutaceae bacterium]